jgi:hypothetical protein
MESSKFYLHVARRALRDLEALPADAVQLGGWTPGEEPRWEEVPSEHFRHAVVCTVFSAAAVEHALVAIALMRKSLGCRGPERQLLDSVWPRMLSGTALVRIARASTKVDPALLSRVEGLVKRRNRIVHSQADDWETPVEGREGWTERGVELPAITPDVIRDAPGDVRIAEEAVEAIQKARGEPEWNPFRESP